MCGEQSAEYAATCRFKGSPPRVRGTGEQGSSMRSDARITPACAGNSQPQILRTFHPQDHPRVCGEQFTAVLFLMMAAGSPPRVRGTVPALAMRRDHPRVCGEQARLAGSTTIRLGSPPRVRGTDGPDRLADQGERITPACAGNRRRGCVLSRRGTDHPRVCGEQLFLSHL